MRTSKGYRNKGLGEKLLTHIENYASLNGLSCLHLEIGSMSFFEPAHRLYLKNGFNFCKPFSDYKANPYSRFILETSVDCVLKRRKNG
ncbi:GNAT family N-acetyltransferase [Parashewanella spongiae]|uniref:GNAT family N-acetyltransferase n=1 Tax=Parashewanella spongiae TaxID=342950 RepID=UPI0028A18239|nr:GNAT family N-acetyltransferase [Parashewanella spongiae]